MAGRAWVYGDNISTDALTPSRYLDRRYSGPEWAKHCLEDVDPSFAPEVRPGDVVVAGRNFGSGSSRESAPLALKHCGVQVIIAKSFARIFFRNAVNIGLLPLIAPDAVDGIKKGDLVEVDAQAGVITNKTTGATFRFHPIPEFLQQIMRAGGLIPFLRAGKKGAASGAKDDPTARTFGP